MMAKTPSANRLPRSSTAFCTTKKIFKELGLSEPKTTDDFFKVMDKVKASGKYTPLALGTNDQWEASQIVYTSIGAPYWHGEEGRKALINGKAKFTDAGFVEPLEVEAKYGPYLAKGYSAQTYADTQNLFASGKAAIVAAGSWDIGYYNQNAQGFELGAFPPPVPKAGDKCYISDHTDLAWA